MTLPREERRSPTRVPNPTCRQCQEVLVRVTVGSQLVGYRCASCDDTWSVAAPVSPSLSTQSS